ncbi:TonB family protein [Sphingomonas sp. YL-JM2C]
MGAPDRTLYAGADDEAVLEDEEPWKMHSGSLVVRPAMERSVYAPSPGNRIAGLVGTAAIFAAVMAACLFTASPVVPIAKPAALTVFDVASPASPSETPLEKKEAPKPVEKREKPPEPQRVRSIEPPKVQISPAAMPAPAAVPKPADPGSREPETAAPKTAPPPPAPQTESKGLDTWEGRVLAQLNRHRRYPRAAMARREQGVPYIRFVMDREGKVLSSRLERSSGFPDLDHEAVTLAKRSAPLPKPPDDKPGDTLELVVPVEFVLTVR